VKRGVDKLDDEVRLPIAQTAGWLRALRRHSQVRACTHLTRRFVVTVLPRALAQTRLGHSRIDAEASISARRASKYGRWVSPFARQTRCRRHRCMPMPLRAFIWPDDLRGPALAIAPRCVMPRAKHNQAGRSYCAAHPPPSGEALPESLDQFEARRILWPWVPAIGLRKPSALLTSTQEALPFDTSTQRQQVCCQNRTRPTRWRFELVFWPLPGAFLIPPAPPVVQPASCTDSWS